MLKSDVIIERFIHSCTYTPSLQAKRLPLFLECTGHFVYGSRYFTEREGLNTYLLLFTIDGCGEIRTPQHRFAVPAGYAALVDGNTWHRYGSKDGTWEMSWIHFSGIGAAAYLSYLFDNGERRCGSPTGTNGWKIWRLSTFWRRVRKIFGMYTSAGLSPRCWTR